MFFVARVKFRKFLLTLAAVFDLLAGIFVCYVGAEPLIPFLAYALGVVSLYTERLWVPVTFLSFGLSMYGAMVLKGEPVALFIVAASLKCISPIFRGWLVLKSEIHELIAVANYLRKNLQALFILPFMLLLILAAVRQVSGDSAMADSLAVYAYYQLSGAVAVVLVLMIREGVSSSNAKRKQWS
ncbi:MAG: hypothetical protein LM590_16215 [Thermofilum sp.]|nr:hypothetical protein [Thermofilum sp.]